MVEGTDRLAAYRAKRDESVTPEPFGGSSQTAVRSFVIQKHAARRLHYDLRLEDAGVLMSWAVPQGISLNPSVMRFAAHTEDHPLDYAGFEGTIPDGAYGAGSMILWDRGTVSFVDDDKHGVEHGKLLFDLNGYKVHGRFTLVKTSKGPNEWLLMKKPDRWATEDDPAFDETSILSGRTVEQVAQGTSGAERTRSIISELGLTHGHGSIPAVSPMLAEVAESPFSRKGWVFEIKYDGYRLLATKSDDLVQLRYRSGLDATAMFPEIVATVAGLPCASVSLDGEVVVLDAEGKPSFGALQRRGRLTNPFDVATAALASPATFFVFDLLSFDGIPTTGAALVDRKRALQPLIPTTGPVLFADHIVERGIEMFESAAALGLEGVMAKRAESTYQPGRSDDWLKIRVEHTSPFLIIGFTRPEGSRMGFGALELAARREGALVHVGRVGTGFTDRTLTKLHRELVGSRRLEPDDMATLIEGLAPDPDSTWVEPSLIAEVRYKEVTDGGNLRHPVFVSDRPDLTFDDVVDLGPAREIPLTAPAAPTQAVTTSNLDKVFWPVEGYTKGDLIAYYDTVANRLLPYLTDRPLVTVRYPDGIEGKSFYQKNAPDFVPASVRTAWIASSDDERGNNYFVCENGESLRYIINLGAIPLHIWASRVSTIDTPDWCVLDLDPKTAPFSSVVSVARRIKKLCDDMEVPSFPKTSGQSGLHILIPMGEGHTYAQQKLLGELIARVVESEMPEIATTVRSPGSRGERVYIDFVQNGRGKLIAAPFAARPVQGATVSTPLRWSEVTPSLDPSRFTIKSLPRRLGRLADDPLAGVLTETSNIAAGLRILASIL